jgi:excisionase family DNA binding protein
MKRMSTRANPAPNPAEEIFTVTTLAAYLHCHPSSIYRLLKDKKVPAFKLGSDWRFRRAAIDEWITKLHGAHLPVTRGRKQRRG